MFLFFFTFIFALTLDLVSKNYFSVLRYFNFEYCRFDQMSLNVNSAFGLGWGNAMMLVVSLGILAGILGYLFAKYDWKSGVNNVAWGLVLGGAVGNIFDRVVFWGVRDFIDCLGYPRFNVADALIVIGVVLLIVFNWKKDEKNS